MTTNQQQEREREIRSRALAFQRELRMIAALVAKLLAKLWRHVEVDDLRGSLPQFIQATQHITVQWAEVAAVVSQEYYAAERKAAGVSGVFAAPQPALPPLPQIEDSVKWATKGLWSQTPDVPQAQRTTEAVVTRLVTGAAHQQIINSVNKDPRAIAWRRIAGDSHPCSFCSLLISRGAIYRSEQAADFRAHDHCECLAVPCFTTQDVKALESNALANAWHRVTAGKSGKAALKAWRDWYDDGGAEELKGQIP